MLDYIPRLKDINHFEKAYLDENMTIFVFSASWCKDCMFINTFMEEVMHKYDHFNFLYVDRDEYLPIANRLEVMGIPSFIAVKNGKEVNRFVSTLRKTKVEIETFLDNLEEK